MAGVDTVRGIAYQQAQAVLTAIEMLDESDAVAIRVEGLDDVVDVEILADDDLVLRGQQIKTRLDAYTWGKGDLLGVLRRWATLPAAASASFEFVTDGRLGPTGEAVKSALLSSSGGDLSPVASLLETDTNDPACRLLGRARVRVDRASTETLLRIAERQVIGLLPAVRTGADAAEQAEQAVGRLFQLLMVRAAEENPSARRVTRSEVAGALGVPEVASGRPTWDDVRRANYLAAACAPTTESIVDAQLEPLVTRVHSLETPHTTNAAEAPTGGDQGRGPLPVLALLETPPTLLCGPTGAGKSTALGLLRQKAAVTGQVVVVVQAEAYVSGRLSALVAEALGAFGALPANISTGRAAMLDPTVTVAIDGVSEIPDDDRRALALELRAQLAAGSGCGVVLAGRDVAELRAVLPATVVPQVFNLLAFDWERRRELVTRMLATTERDPERVRQIVAQAEAVLGDAAANPYLLSRAVHLILTGIPFTDRAGMYAGLVEQMAARGGATDIVTTTVTLGTLFAGLLDEGRRYCDPFEWQHRLLDVVTVLAGIGVTVQPVEIEEAARRSGLVVPTGYRQILVPAHDSLADFLAAVSHARGVARLPVTFHAADAQRLQFLAEIQGVDAELANTLARDLPFLTVVIAKHDRRDLDEQSLSEVSVLLDLLLPQTRERPTVGGWRDSLGRTILTTTRDEASRGWWNPQLGLELFRREGGHIIEGGPLQAAVTLWKAELKRILSSATGAPGMPYPRNATEARDALESHAISAREQLAQLVPACCPTGQAELLMAEIGPIGLHAAISEQPDAEFGHWPVFYRRIDDAVSVRVANEDDRSGWNRSSVDYLLSKSPAREAASRVADALERLAATKWLT